MVFLPKSPKLIHEIRYATSNGSLVASLPVSACLGAKEIVAAEQDQLSLRAAEQHAHAPRIAHEAERRSPKSPLFRTSETMTTSASLPWNDTNPPFN